MNTLPLPRPAFRLGELIAAFAAAVSLEPLSTTHDEVTAADCEAQDDMLESVEVS